MKKIIIIIFAIFGGIIGTVLGNLAANIPQLSFLSIGGEIGTKTPIILDLSFMQLTFGIWLKINIAGILFFILLAISSIKVTKWLKV